MKKIYLHGLSAALLFSSLGTQAQNRPASPSYALGTSQGLVQQLETQVTKSAAQRTAAVVTLRVSASHAFTGKVNYRQDLSTTGENLVGEIQGVPSSSFQLRIEGKKVEGSIILRKTKQAYRYTADAQGNVSVQEIGIDRVLCTDFAKPVGYQNPAPTRKTTGTASKLAVVSLQSMPGARGCLLLDFDGQYVAGTIWNNGNPINAAPSGMNDVDIRESWELVSEDFRPFSLNVTTDEAVFNSYPKYMRRRCIITPTTTAAPNTGGSAFVGSFSLDDDTPCWVFMMSPKACGEACSHEFGHTLGLSHDGLASAGYEYYSGQGTWAPIMGSPYDKPTTQWSQGEYDSASNHEDDLAIISGPANNVGYRNDDHSNGTVGATALVRSGTSLSSAGIIERNTDYDFFSFATGSGTVSLNVNTVSRHGDLDLVARLYNDGGILIGTYDAVGLNTSLSVNVAAGVYYLSVDGTGSDNPFTDGYSDYASLGTFSISGNAPAPPPTQPLPRVATFYRDCAFGGTAIGLEAGDYTLSQLTARGILDNDISSLKINTGYEVQIFANDNFQGVDLTLTAGNDCLAGAGWDNQITSLKVRTSGVFDLSGIYTVQNRNSGLFLDVDGASQADLTPLIQWPANSCDCQKFRFTHLGSGAYRIEAVNSGKALSVSERSTASGAAIVQRPYASEGSQQFVVQDVGQGFYRLVAKHSSQLIEVAGASRDSRARVQQWPNNGASCQQWKLTPVTSTPPPPPPPVFSTLLQAESFNLNNGMVVESCTDTGGGQDMGYVDGGDYLVFNNINFPTTGSYLVEYRIASGAAGGTVSCDLNGGSIQLGATTVPGTGGWQTWRTVSRTVTVNAGTYNFGIYAQAGGWNINWIRITKSGSNAAAASLKAEAAAGLTVYPNPVVDQLTVSTDATLAGSSYRILNALGQPVASGILERSNTVNVATLREGGMYTLIVTTQDHRNMVSRFTK